MSDEIAPNDAATFCANEVREHAFAQYATTLFIAPAQQRDLLALYAFNHEIASVRHHISQPLPGEIRLQWWADTLSGNAQHGSIEGHPVAAALLQAIKARNLPIDDFLRFIDAYRFDLYDDPMPALDALEGHLIDTDAILFSLAARICAPTIAAPGDLIHHAGLAQGLVRTIGLLPTHASRRQLYLPKQILDLNAVNIEDVFAGKPTSELNIALTYIRHTAQEHLNAARKLLAKSDSELALAFLPLVLTQKSLRQMERAEFDPFRRSQPSRLSILWTLWRAARHPPFRR
jgi:phytoene synthase